MGNQALVSDERGVGAIVATVILLILFVVALVVFWNSGVGDHIMNVIGKIFG